MTAIELTEEMIVSPCTFRRRALVCVGELALALATVVSIVEGGTQLGRWLGDQVAHARAWAVRSLARKGVAFTRAYTCGLKSWAELLQPEKYIRCGLTVLKGNIKRTGKLRAALVAYNGSGPDSERYGERVLARIAEKLIEGRP